MRENVVVLLSQSYRILLCFPLHDGRSPSPPTSTGPPIRSATRRRAHRTRHTFQAISNLSLLCFIHPNSDSIETPSFFLQFQILWQIVHLLPLPPPLLLAILLFPTPFPSLFSFVFPFPFFVPCLSSLLPSHPLFLPFFFIFFFLLIQRPFSPKQAKPTYFCFDLNDTVSAEALGGQVCSSGSGVSPSISSTSILWDGCDDSR